MRKRSIRPPLRTRVCFALFLLSNLSLFCCGRDGNATRATAKERSFADMIDRALQKEFPESEQAGGENDEGNFSNSVADKQAVLETVARVKSSKNDTKEKSFQFQDVFNLDNENHGQDVPTLIDRKDNVFIISNPKSKYPVLQLDLRLISDLVVVIVSATCGGIAFACVGQPVITGYLLAGSIIGPGGLKFVSEMVQVETVSQFGVIFLLFALGLEFSPTKLRIVRAVAILGGLLQIFLFICITGIMTSFIAGQSWNSSERYSDKVLQTAKRNNSNNSRDHPYAHNPRFHTKKICTIRDAMKNQDLAVLTAQRTAKIQEELCGGKLSEGLFLGALLSMSSSSVVLKFLKEQNSVSALHGQITAGILMLQDCAVGLFTVLLPVLGGTSSTLQGVISMARLLAVLCTFLGFLSILTHTCVPRFLNLMLKLSSQTNELYQLVSVAFCLLVAWCGDKVGLSLELGSFVAGVMISTTGLSQHTLEQIEPIRNLFAALFLACVGMLMHVNFLWSHADILIAAVILLIIIKTSVTATVVKCFGYTNKTSLRVGLSLAQTGEFAFVLLSRASNLHLIEGKLYLLLLGTTTLSLLTTSLLLKLIPTVIRRGVLLRWFPPDRALLEVTKSTKER